MTSYTDPGFGHFLSNDAELLAAYRAETGAYLTDAPRVVDVWRTRGAAARGQFSPAEAERWLQAQPGAGDQDLADLRALATVWMNQAQRQPPASHGRLHGPPLPGTTPAAATVSRGSKRLG